MDIHHLRVFSSVYKNKSFSKASEELNLTQPTISNHIKALEDELGCKLFDRLGRSIMPTKEAEVLYSHSTELIEKALELKEAISEVRKDVSGRIVIGASTIPGVYILPKIISGFQKRYPSISYQILISDSGGIIENVMNHDLLLGIVGAKLSNEHVEYISYIDDELIAVSAPSVVNNNKMTLQEFVKYPFILREEGSGTRRETEKFLERRGITIDKLHINGIFGSTDAVKQAVKAGLGVTILSKYSVEDEINYGILRKIDLANINIRRRFYIVKHKKRTLPKAYETFLEYVISSSKED
jgi:DNA-binding transcriptional LysR family regulator